MLLTREDNTNIKPFLTWAGGKRWLVKNDNQIAPSYYKRYIEPFVGGAAVFFSLPNSSYIIADSNLELINSVNSICKCNSDSR